jgi:MFS transporter, MHS family, proline/betaine transporter
MQNVGSRGALPCVRARTKELLGATIGNVLEWYDFTLYAFFASYIARQFFPSSNPTAQLLQAFVVYGLGYLARPVGAVVIGGFADTRGRKPAMLLTFSLMAVGTLIIVLTPPVASIGTFATTLILVARLIQGFSSGGEAGSSAAFLIEHARPDRRASTAALVQIGMAAANVLGTLAATAVIYSFSQAALESWAWRLPFALGLLIVPVGLYLRRNLGETEEFKQIMLQRKRHNARVSPLASLFRDGLGPVVMAFSVTILWTATLGVLVLYLPTYSQAQLGFSASSAYAASLLGNIVVLVTAWLGGRCADRLGQRTVLLASACASICLVYPALLWLSHHRTPETLLAVQFLFGALTGSYCGVAASTLLELFPAHNRSSGVSIGYNTAVVIFGGFSPAILTWLGSFAGLLAPAFYVMTAAALSLLAVLRLPAGSLAEVRASPASGMTPQREGARSL